MSDRPNLLQRAEQLWKDLQENNLGGFSGINRPFWIVQAFKEVETAATDKARREALLECAEIAKKYRTEAELERHKTDDSEGKECWLWAFDTSNAIERDIRALAPQNPGDAAPESAES